jgi:cation diffusion facilitator family transporter
LCPQFEEVYAIVFNFLISHFIKDHRNTDNPKVRDAYGYLGGIVGIILNSILFVIKLSAGILTKSIAITADAFNNLSDAASSVITILGFKLAGAPADREHPFGHGRIEYLSGLVVSSMVLLVGFEFVKSSFERILHPSKITFVLIPFVLILASVAAKIWLSGFNKHVGKAINSSALQASSFDSLADVFISGCTAISLLISKWTTFPLDGYIGMLVSLFILYAGFSLIKETLNPLLGEAPDPELVERIIDELCSYDYISGVHDLIIHNYGPGRIMASAHAEVPCDISITKIHEVIDKAEREISSKNKLYLVIHMDPINTNDAEVEAARIEVLKVTKLYPMIKSIHDFRVVGEGKEKNLIFDVVIDFKHKITKEFEDDLRKKLNKDIKAVHSLYNIIITIDRDFT